MSPLALFLALLQRFFAQLSGQSVGPIDPPPVTPPTVAISSITAGSVTLNLGNLLPGDTLDWGDGTTVPASSSLTRTYATSGTRTVTVIRGGVAGASISVTVTIPPVDPPVEPPAPATVTVASIVDATVTLTLGSLQSGDTLDWGDGVIVAAASTLTHTYSASGTRTARVLRGGVVVASVMVSVAISPLYVEPDPATINWGAPIVITDAYLTAQGSTQITTGEHAGRWPITLDHPALNLVSGDCAVWVNTTKPLLLRHSTWCGVGGEGTGRGAIGNGTYGVPVGNSTFVDVVIEDCTQVKPSPSQMQNGQYAGGLRFAYPKNVKVQNSNINGPGLLVAELNPADGGTVKFKRNKVRNVDGRIVDKTQPDGWKLEAGSGSVNARYVQAIQLDKVRNTPGIEIADNDIENLPGQSRVEDNINTYQSGGTAASPLMIFRNLINGAYAGHPNDGFSGSAVVMGDEGGDYTEATDNTAVNTSNTAISMSSMNYGKILRNKMAQTGLLPDGSRVDANGTNIDQGVYARNYAAGSGFVMDKLTNVVDDNDIAWGAPLDGQPDRQLNYGFSDNASVGPIGNRVYGLATPALIQQLISDHRAAWQAAGVIVGRRKP